MTVIVTTGTDDPRTISRAADYARAVYQKFPDVGTIKKLVTEACG